MSAKRTTKTREARGIQARHRTSTPSDSAPGIYVPDNPALADVIIEARGQGFRPDYARLLLYFISVKKWMGDLDKSGFAILNAVVLRRWIHPRLLGPLKQYLVERGVLLTAPYSTGHFSTGFRIASAYEGSPERCVIEYAHLAGKLRAWRSKNRTAGDDPGVQAVITRRRPLLDHLRDSLNALSLPSCPEKMAEGLRNVADANHVAYVAQCIENRDHDGISVDAFGCRIHNLITRTSSHLRPLLRLDGQPVVEVDVANSQPLLLAILVQHKEYWYNIMEGSSLSPSSPCSVSHASAFLDVCERGLLYDLLADDCGISRENAKHEFFRDVLFGKSHVSGRITRAFGNRWPSVLHWVRELKREHGYKVVARALQRLESMIILDGIASRLLRDIPGVPFLTIHDSALLVANAAENVRQIMVDEFVRWGAKPTVRVKYPHLETWQD